MLDAGEVEPGLQQGGDLTDPFHVVTAVPAGAAFRAERRQQALALVGPQHLRVDPRELGRDRDRVHGALVIQVDHQHAPPNHVSTEDARNLAWSLLLAAGRSRPGRSGSLGGWT